MKNLILLLISLFQLGYLIAQDTFSIVAVDSLTGEVGSAGASCISADNLQLFFPNDDPDFLGKVLPGRGAINTQSFYNAQNQANASARLAAGDTPQQVVEWLFANDAEGNSSTRQYGVAALQNGQPMAAGFTGFNCYDFKDHRVGPNYSIQGNILLGPEILDSMEARFVNTPGCLAEKIMAAMQGAKVPGADTRCDGNGTSSMFAFIKVAKPDDDAENPSLRLFVAYNPVGIEPIDSLQALFDAAGPCVSSSKEKKETLEFKAMPNPSAGKVALQFSAVLGAVRLDVFDVQGRLLQNYPSVLAGEEIQLPGTGNYLLKLTDSKQRSGTRMIRVQ